MTGDGSEIVIAGTRRDWPGGARTLTPRDPGREPNRQNFWFGADLDPDGNQVWFRIAGTPGAAAQRLRRQVDALSDCRGPHVFDAEDVRLVIEYLEANERTGARLAEHEADKRLCEQEETE